MKRIILLTIALLILNFISKAQPYTFSNTTSYSIPDNDGYVAGSEFAHGVTSTITVSGIEPTAVIDHVTVNLTHPYDGDLQIYLVYYGIRKELSTDNGSSGANYTNTTFSNSAATLITAGSPPYNGTYRPEQDLPSFGSPDYAFNPNGDWILHVCDDAGGDVGTIDSWSITFDKPNCPTVDFHDEDGWVMTCDSASDLLSVNNAATAGGTSYPALYFQFDGDSTATSYSSNVVTIYEDGSAIWSGHINSNTRTTVHATGAYFSPSSNYTIDISISGGTMDYLVFDGNGSIPSPPTNPGTVSSNTSGLGPWSPVGSATWTGTGISGTNDYGYALFDPTTVGAGTYNVTYNWDNQGSGTFGCSGSMTHTITVNNPYSAAWTPPAAMCPEAANVELNALVTGDAGGTWSGTGVTGGHYFDPSVGTQNITYTYDGGGSCEVSETHAITVYTSPTATATHSTPTCAGSPLSLTGGANGMSSYSWTGPNSYSSSSQSPTVSATATTAMSGTYTLTIQDSHGCTNTASTTLTVNPQPTATATHSTPTCAGSPLSLTGGANGMSSYSWTGPNSYSSSSQSPTVSSSATSAMSGTYTISVTDGNGCSNTASTTLTVNPQPTATATSNSPVCAGDALTLTGGANGMSSYSWTGPNSYSSSNQSPIVSSSATTAMSGTYTISVTDGNGCSNTASTTVTVNSLPVVYAGADQTISNGTSTSINDATVTPSGSYNYSWTPAGSLTNATVLNPTTVNLSSTTQFIFTATDQTTSCPSLPDTVVIFVTGGPLTVVGANDTICNGESVTLNAMYSGGSGTYTYSWTSIPAGFTSTQANPTVSPTVTTTYHIIVDDGFNTANDDITIIVNPLPNVTAAYSPNDTLCFGEQLTLTGTGNADTYTWNNGVSDNVAFTPSIGNTTYIVTGEITTTGCTNTDTVDIIVNPVPNVTALFSPNDTLCFGEQLTLTGTGNADTYTWNNGVSDNVAFIPSIGNTTYIVIGEITTTGCTNTDTVDIVVNPLPNVTANSNDANNTICYGDSITLFGTGNANTYTWDNGVIDNVGFIPSSGNLTYIVTGEITTTGCLNTDTIDILVNSLPNVTANSNDANNTICFNDSIILYGTGNADYYNWDNGVTDSIGFVPLVGTVSYILTGGDTATGCLNYDTISVTVNPLPVIDSFNITDVTVCSAPYDGVVVVNVSGGLAPYQYSFNGSSFSTTNHDDTLNVGSVNITVLDANSCSVDTFTNVGSNNGLSIDTVITTDLMCNGDSSGIIVINDVDAVSYSIDNGNNYLPTDSFPNLPAGIYSVMIKDAGNCLANQSVTLTEPTVISIDSTVVDAGCGATGQASVTVTGGTPGYTYLWNTTDTIDSISNVLPGNYMITVTDSHLCQDSLQVIVGGTGAAGSMSVVNQTNVDCNGNSTGAVTVQMNSGTPPYNYNWSTGDTLETLDSLQAGTYYVTISDNYGCEAKDTIIITEPTAISSIPASANVLCFGGNTGQINLLTTGGTPPYTYNWSNGSTDSTAINLFAGTYSVTVIDNNQCPLILNNISVTQPDSLYAILSPVNPICYNGDEGYISTQVFGGTKPYNYSWSNGDTDTLADNLTSGTYYLTLTDAHYCPAIVVAQLANPPAIQISGTVDNNNGNITVVVDGGTAPYTYSWSNGDTSLNLSHAPSGEYIFTVTDNNTCAMIDTFEIKVELQIPLAITPNGDGYNDTWFIKGLDGYENISIEIYNRWGNVIYTFTGTGTEYNYNSVWDGTYKGKQEPVGSFVYVINLNDGNPPITGTFTLIR